MVITFIRGNSCIFVKIFHMERLAYEELVFWKRSANRKPLIIQGARQVGKTWLMKEFGKREYENVAYINFESSAMLRSLFSNDFEIERILLAFEIESGTKIEASTALIILDEIQEAASGITMLKYFFENAPQYHIMAAGSLLGVSLHQETSFPVGKVEIMNLYPLSFNEFLLAMNQVPLVEILKANDWVMVGTFKFKIIELLRQFYYVGGMPEAVYSFSLEKDFEKVRKIQKDILYAYENDFSKYAPIESVPRIKMIWNSILSQLSRENKKFIFGALKEGSRAKEFDSALNWLTASGLIYKVHRVTKPALPLISYMELGAFKLFMLDVGLLSAFGDLGTRTLLDGNSIFTEFKGALTEQFVLQNLKTRRNLPVFYWSSSSATAEIDFLVQANDLIIPIEVKAEENLKAKSLKVYSQKFQPPVSIRTSMTDFRVEEWLINVPLYAIDSIRFESLAFS